MSIYHANFNLLKRIIDFDQLKRNSFLKFSAVGMMDFAVDLLTDLPDQITVAVAHNYEQNGDIMADPDMEIIIDLREHTARALSYQQDSLGVYYRLDDNEECSTSVRKELNIFLGIWLSNILSQGYKLQAGYRDE